MKNIVTVTLNPAYDLHYYMESFIAERENYVSRAVCEAGGKGINISRALSVNGTKSKALVVLGNENKGDFEKQLRDDGIDYIPICTEGRIRENITLHPTSAAETRISLDNFSISENVLSEAEDKISREINENTLIAFSGRIPKGVEKRAIKDFLKRLSALGARLVVDSNSFNADDLAEIRPWLIKPNEQEIAAFSHGDIKDREQAAQIATELCRSGVAECVMISLGAFGAVWSDGKKRAIVSIPSIGAPLSTIGAGDSTLAGYLAATAKGESIEDTLRLACSYGTAACFSEGTRPPQPERVKEVFKKITVDIMG